MTISDGASPEHSVQYSPMPVEPVPPAPNISLGDLFAVLLPVVATCVIYFPNLPTTFVGMDLEAYKHVIETQKFLDTSLALFSDFKGRLVVGYYAPLGSISLMLDKWFSGAAGPDPYTTSLINLLLHCLNGVCILVLLKIIGAPSVVSGITIFLFLVHPVQVSSVLWFAERKTLLGGVFYFLCIASYLGSRIHHSKRLWWLSLILFILSVLTKPVCAVIPAILAASEALLPLPSLKSSDSFAQDASASAEKSEISSCWVRLQALVTAVRPLAGLIGPFILVAAFASGLTVFTERPPTDSLPLPARILNLAPVLWYYVTQVPAPVDMMFIHPKQRAALSQWGPSVPFVFLGIAIAFTLFRIRRRNYMPVFGYAAFFIALTPALGLVPFGFLQYSPVADHFLYLAMFGASFSIAWDVAAQRKRRHRRNISVVVLSILSAAVAMFLMFQTWTYTNAWRSVREMWKHNAAKCPGCAVAQYELGCEYGRAGQWKEAIRRFNAAKELQPDLGYPDGGLALAYEHTGDFAGALVHYRRAMELLPRSDTLRRNLAKALLKEDRLDDAIKVFYAAFAINPYSHEIAADLGASLLLAKRFPEAARAYAKAIAIYNNNAEYYNGLGVACAELNRRTEAGKCFLKALKINPNHAGARANLEALGHSVETLGLKEQPSDPKPAESP